MPSEGHGEPLPTLVTTPPSAVISARPTDNKAIQRHRLGRRQENRRFLGLHTWELRNLLSVERGARGHRAVWPGLELKPRESGSADFGR